MLTESYAREEICRVGRSLFERGYVHATAGNISVRLSDGNMLITPTDACLGFLRPETLSLLDSQGQRISGERASKTALLHRAVVDAASTFDDATRCVIHTHSTHCVALTLKHTPDELLAPITPYFVMKVGRVPVIPYYRPGDPRVAELVADVINRYGRRSQPVRAVMLARLGPTVWHQSPAQAMAVLEELEETARLVNLAGEAIPPLSEPDIDELRRTFGARW